MTRGLSRPKCLFMLTILGSCAWCRPLRPFCCRTSLAWAMRLASSLELIAGALLRRSTLQGAGVVVNDRWPAVEMRLETADDGVGGLIDPKSREARPRRLKTDAILLPSPDAIWLLGGR